jgi:hypothetical protein
MLFTVASTATGADRAYLQAVDHSYLVGVDMPKDRDQGLSEGHNLLCFRFATHSGANERRCRQNSNTQQIVASTASSAPMIRNDVLSDVVRNKQSSQELTPHPLQLRHG